MIVRHSDTVVHDHRLYRVFMAIDGKEYVSTTPPTHAEGTEVLDGITWVMVQEGDEHSCGCRNIVFRDIFLEKHRPVAFSFHFDDDNYSHSVYPNSVMPVQTDILFDNVIMNAPIPTFLYTITPVNQIKITNSVLQNTGIDLVDIGIEGIEYVKDDIVFSGVSFKGDGENTLVKAEGRRSAMVRSFMSHIEGDFKPVVEGNVTIGVNDIGIATK